MDELIHNDSSFLANGDLFGPNEVPEDPVLQYAKIFIDQLNCADYIISTGRSVLTAETWRYGLWLGSFFTMCFFYQSCSESKIVVDLPGELHVAEDLLPVPIIQSIVSDGADSLAELILRDRSCDRSSKFLCLLDEKLKKNKLSDYCLRSLKHLSMIQIRNIMKRNCLDQKDVTRYISGLPVPQAMKSVLRLEDVKSKMMRETLDVVSKTIREYRRIALP